ncbi:MAG: sulfite exporter TauE/SafE family protein [Burkholderiaceae bacterium]|nr:sulfite exporter TauE/SafE family protein [Burkholderiaceae bacterium]
MSITLLLGVLVGAILGLTGAGGGVLAVPALVAGMGWTMQQAAPVALIAIAGAAALGAIEGLRKGLVRYKAATLMVVAGIPFTSVGLLVAQKLPQRWLLGLFAAVMLIVAIRLLLQSQGSQESNDDRVWARINPDSGRFHWSWATGALFGVIGAVTGFLTGMLGVGGGFVIVPALRRYTDVSMHGVVATSLMSIALIGTGGIVSALVHDVTMPLQATLWFAAATAIGMLAGRKAVAYFTAHHVQRGFSLVLIVVAGGMLGKALQVF